MEEPIESIVDFIKVTKECWFYYENALNKSGSAKILMSKELMENLYRVYDPNTICYVNNFLCQNKFFIIKQGYLENNPSCLPDDQKLFQLGVEFFKKNPNFNFLPSVRSLMPDSTNYIYQALTDNTPVNGKPTDGAGTRVVVKEPLLRRPRIKTSSCWDVKLCADIISKIYAYYKTRPVRLNREDMEKEIGIIRLSRHSHAYKKRLLKFFEYFLEKKRYIEHRTALSRAYITNTYVTSKTFPSVDELEQPFKDFTRNITPQDLWTFNFPKPKLLPNSSNFVLENSTILDESAWLASKYGMK